MPWWMEWGWGFEKRSITRGLLVEVSGINLSEVKVTHLSASLKLIKLE